MSKAEFYEREAREMREMATEFPRASDNAEFWLNQARIRDGWVVREREEGQR